MTTNGRAPNGAVAKSLLEEWDKRLKHTAEDADFHGDDLIADKQIKLTGLLSDILRVVTPKNVPEILHIVIAKIRGQPTDNRDVAQLIGSMSNDSKLRAKLAQTNVKGKYEKMLHPPLTYLGDAFSYRAADGKFNSVLHPHLGRAGAPYAKTVPSKTHPLGALPDPGDVFDRLMARQENGRNSASGLSSLLIYHATIIIHDIFRTNDKDKNISDSSSYLDLSPLYGYTMEMQKQVRDDRFKLGLLKPDTFAEDRLLRQPPGVCIMLVMYNRYHNYAATQLKRINENGRFSIPAQYEKPKWLAVVDACIPTDKRPKGFSQAHDEYKSAHKAWSRQGQKPLHDQDKVYETAEASFSKYLCSVCDEKHIEEFKAAHDAAWDKLDNDLFNTARLITCGMYVNISIHDYLRALMGFHQFDSNFTLDPRVDMTEHKNVSRGLGNQVTVEFNLLYRFHCAISQKDEQYTERFISETFEQIKPGFHPDPKNLSFEDFGLLSKASAEQGKKEPSHQEFGLKNSATQSFKRNAITGLFDDEQMINQLLASMDDPISNFGPRNVPKALKVVEIMGIMQARKWEIGTLNDFRDFFGMPRHTTFESISKNTEIQEALRDLYDHPDKIELYPGVFCESDAKMDADPGPSELKSALWMAIFSDAITLVRSDRFYTVDWNTNSLTSWGMAEVTPDNSTLKSSVFHRLLQRSFPEWFPYNSIRFFHPFYTATANAKFAEQQGYLPDFKVQKVNAKGGGSSYDTKASEPRKPNKPEYLSSYRDIQAILATGADEIVHPAYADKANFSEIVWQAISTIKAKSGKVNDDSLEDVAMTKAYFSQHVRTIVEREVIIMDKKKSIFQLDVTRDLAIPVVTRCIADFLGFGDQIRDIGNKKAKYTENELYRHITNCQTFLSYNTDETKLIKRRNAFKESMNVLIQLAQEGNIRQARRWSITKAIRGVAGFFFGILKARKGDTAASKGMKNLGKLVAARIVATESNSSKAAAILILTALDIAYVSVLAFTAVLDELLEGAYDRAKEGSTSTCDWFEIQNLALKNDDKSDKKIAAMILQAQIRSIRLPFIRKVLKDTSVTIGGHNRTFHKDQIIICDIFKAMKGAEPRTIEKYGHLNYTSSLSRTVLHFNPKDIAVHGLTAMIKTMAQMKNLRRSHTFQGTVKKIAIDQTYEGYANFMAPGRMQSIAYDAENAEAALEQFQEAETKNLEPAKGMSKDKREVHKQLLQQRIKDAGKVFTEDILKPAADTYLTAEWDEFLPFPTTWKLRFEGYGPSNYGTGLALLRPKPLPDSFPPFYQPQGSSHYGGAFGDIAPKVTPADAVKGTSGGCGAMGAHL